MNRHDAMRNAAHWYENQSPPDDEDEQMQVERWTPPPDALVALCRERRSYLYFKRTGTPDSLAAFLLPGAHAYYRRARAAAFQPRRLP